MCFNFFLSFPFLSRVWAFVTCLVDPMEQHLAPPVCPPRPGTVALLACHSTFCGAKRSMTSHLSEYERKRLENIERNKVVLRKLGLASKRRRTARTKSPPSTAVSKKVKAEKTPSTKRKQKNAVLVPRRKSSRLKVLKPKYYTQVKITIYSSSIAEQRLSGSVRKNNDGEVLEKSMEWLKATRENFRAVYHQERDFSSGSSRKCTSQSRYQNGQRCVPMPILYVQRL